MALLQISEPGERLQQPDVPKRAIGIDLGTTHSLVATYMNGAPNVLEAVGESGLLPSAVRYLEGGAVEVGHPALRAYTDDTANSLISVKRFMGRRAQEHALLDLERVNHLVVKDGLPYFQTVQGDKSPVEVSAEILKALRVKAEAELGGDIEGAVITVPAYFDDAQRQATKDAATLAGLKVLRLLNEPTAAAVAYGLDQLSAGQYLVFDLGGGTFDVSILKMERGVFQVLATGGDSALGGDDFDAAITNWFMRAQGIEQPDIPLLREIQQAAKLAKEQLSRVEAVAVSVMYQGQQCCETLTRECFFSLIEPLLQRTITICRHVLDDAGLEAASLDHIILVGGSTRVLSVADVLKRAFDSVPLNTLDPDRVVAQGAALQADALVGNKRDDESALLLDVTPLSLGVETMGGLVEKIIPRNTAIPVTRAQEFTTYQDGQTAMSIHVVQGERERVEDGRSLAKFALKGIPPMVAGAAKVRVSYQVDADGLLSVSAKELTTGVESDVQVKPSYGLEAAQITRMLKESYEHAQEDVSHRMLREQQIDGERLWLALNEALLADGERLLSEKEYSALALGLDDLRAAVEGADIDAIEAEIVRVNQASELFASRRMDESIQHALTGLSLNELSDEMQKESE